MPQTLVRLDDLLQFPIESDCEPPAKLELARPIPFHAICEQHLLPFHGAVHIGFVPGENRLKQPEFARMVEACSGGIQIQQRMTTRIGLWLYHQLAPRGVGVLVDGAYSCATAHGGSRVAGPTSTLAFYGSLRHSAERQREFLTRTRQQLIRFGVE